MKFTYDGDAPNKFVYNGLEYTLLKSEAYGWFVWSNRGARCPDYVEQAVKSWATSGIYHAIALVDYLNKMFGEPT
jgi:hypothetical protein